MPKLEQLFRENWRTVTPFGESMYILAKGEERIVFDYIERRILIKYTQDKQYAR